MFFFSISGIKLIESCCKSDLHSREYVEWNLVIVHAEIAVVSLSYAP